MLRFGCSLRSQFIAAAIVLVGISATVGYAASYVRTQRVLAASLGRELLGINSTAPRLNGDVLSFITPLPDGGLRGREEFEEARAVLLQATQANGLEHAPGQSPLSILRPAEDTPGELEFVVMTDPDATGKLYAGNRYPAMEHHLRALSGHGMASGVYSDAAGLWISAVAPVRSSNGKIVGLLQADRPVNFLHQQARTEAQWLALAALSTLVAGALPAVLLARSLTRPVHEPMRATQQLAAGNLNHAVKVDRCDELGALSAAVNDMPCSSARRVASCW